MPKDNYPPYFQLYVDDFITDAAVDAMSNEELGIYFRLLCKAWKENPAGTIPAEEKILAAWGKTSTTIWKRCRENVLRAFVLIDGRYHQKRLKLEWEKMVQRCEERSKSGSKGAAKRWQSHSVANGRANGTATPEPMAKNGYSDSESYSDRNYKSDSGESPRKFQPRGDYFDLSAVDWGQVTSRAEAAARRVPPRSEIDRRAWLTYAVLSVTSFSENWLIDAAEAVERASETTKNRRAHFVAALKSKAQEEGTDPETFKALCDRIRIPNEIWNSPALGGPTP